MKILIGTPVFGGMITTEYFQSILTTLGLLNQKGNTCSVLLAEDGLISRARNGIATIALEHNFDKVLFIDSDISWKPEHLQMLFKSKREIIGGTYPFKSLPIRLNFNAYPDTEPYENGEMEVENVPTGFMIIDVSVFKRLSEVRPKYSSWNAATETYREVFDFFPIRLVDSKGSKVKGYETEDWGFCSVAREAGFRVFLQTNCVVDHVGKFTFTERKQ